MGSSASASRDRFRRRWDREAPSYDRRTSWVEQQFFGPSRQWVCGRARGRVLEVAVGTGANLAYYSRDVELTGIDWSQGMLEQARHRAAQLALAVDLRQADAMALPFETGSFDSVVCTFSLCGVPDETVVLSEMTRVLRPGGELLLADHIPSTSWPLRMLQRSADVVTGRWQGEYFCRRPSLSLAKLPVQVIAIERHSRGVIEQVHARGARW